MRDDGLRAIYRRAQRLAPYGPVIARTDAFARPETLIPSLYAISISNAVAASCLRHE